MIALGEEGGWGEGSPYKMRLPLPAQLRAKVDLWPKPRDRSAL